MKNLLAAFLLSTAPLAPHARADEGMWTLDNPPIKQLRERYGFTPSPEWLEKVRMASLRFNDGGSGSFVSEEGLVLTNHHVALGQLQKVSSEKADYVRDGFFAKTRAEEMRCPDLELNMLVSMEEVTARVLAAIDPKSPEEEQNKQRKSEMARVEKESTDKTGLRSDVVELYQGGEYWLYRYKKYTDIRLAMAPEFQAAFYGGDPDNFTYPRFDTDFALFRVYEDGKPVKPKHYFRWSEDGAENGELVFVSGHPGRTDRLMTMAQLERQRDYALPAFLKSFKLRLRTLKDYSARGPEQARRAKDRIFGHENAIKANVGRLEGLLDPKLLAAKAAEEKALREKAPDRAPWDRIAQAQTELTTRHKDLFYARVAGSKLFGIAEHLVRMAAELEKPNEKRYEEYRDSALESLKFRLFSPAPIYGDLEEALLASSLEESLQELGAGHPWVQAALGGADPKRAAALLVSGTGLFDPQARKTLAAGGVKALRESKDPMIAAALRLDPLYREQRSWYEDKIQSVESLQGNRIAKARFAAYGKSSYPDATFTLRLSYGKVAGYERGTTFVPYKTTFHGLYDRAASFDGKPPFDLSKAFAKAKGRVRMETPLDFATTNDIIGGNSGSPVINAKAELVGLIFDGNIEGLVLDYAYTEERARAVAVHSAGILETLRDVYGMNALAGELLSGKP